MKSYDLMPTNGRKSFYGKARVEVDDNGNETLISYQTKVMVKEVDGTMKRLWNGWTATTGTHIHSFSGLCKKDFLNLPLA